MDILFVALVAFLASGLTLFSGFGLGTILMPAFALLMPVEVAIGATAVVHLANNLFKLALVGRRADPRVLLRFAVPAALAAVLGALLLVRLSDLPTIATWTAFGSEHRIEALPLAIGTLIAAFALLELSPAFARLQFPARFLPLGGLVSGFFGGLSGNQGAFRTAFLIKAGLSKEAFIATGVVAAVIVDVTRLSVYGLSHFTRDFADLTPDVWTVVGVAALCAFLGAFIGSRILKKVTLRGVQITVAATMLALGIGLALGLI
ncbi:TSUP family transporter [Faunimonas sp. B44]|uniref:TSUP family transporter n=1 Tax=Faunimonas sp. B44 TaxID=3461493 RepID=UPI004043CD0F